ncbi:MAG: FAD-dependent thymidylate synthase [Gaiellales bacterium]|nr:MAG: FAD-dependent thymidylate synthase [Gaiellales bacterium]
MEIVEQSWEFISVTAPWGYSQPFRDTIDQAESAMKLIEKAGRTCYKSENKITPDSADKFVQMLVDKGHHAMIEHVVIGAKMITDRGVTHEIVRHRIASYAQESTRYCNYGKLGVKFIKPVDFELDEVDMAILGYIEAHYNYCLNKGRSPQQARYFLPNGLKTEIVMTANVREWLHFFNLRTSPAAHPQMRALATSMLVGFAYHFPVLFGNMATARTVGLGRI